MNSKIKKPIINFTSHTLNDKKQREVLVNNLLSCLTHPGYFYLNPSPFISRSHLKKCYVHVENFHRLQAETKKKYLTELNKNSRGWIPLFAEPSYEAGKISYVESFDLALDIAEDDPLSKFSELGPNVYPDAEIPEFRQDISNLYDKTTTLADIIFELIAEAAGLEKNTFLKHATRKRRSHMRLLSYPGSKDKKLEIGSNNVPFMITNKMRKVLFDLGYSSQQIKAMTPIDAQNIINQSNSKQDPQLFVNREYETLLQPKSSSSVSGNSTVGSYEGTDTAVGISSHTDFECFTFLHQNASGLQIQLKDGTWIVAEPPLMQPDEIEEASSSSFLNQGTDHSNNRYENSARETPVPCFTVILGDMIERWTNGQFRATPHRVPLMPHPRMSIVRFNGVDSDVLVQPLPQFVPAGEEAASLQKYPPVTQGDHIQQMMSKGLSNLKELQDSGMIPRDVFE